MGDLADYTRLFRAYDVLEADSEEELIDVVQATAKTRRLGLPPLPPGARIGIATTSGGAGVWLADACAARGLAVPGLSAPVQELLKGHMPPFGSPVNPVDLTAQLTAGGSVAPALVSVDGETLAMEAPLLFLSQPGALRVRLPPHAAGISPAARAVRILSRSTVSDLARVCAGRPGAVQPTRAQLTAVAPSVD